MGSKCDLPPFMRPRTDPVPPKPFSSPTSGPWRLPHFADPEAHCDCGYVLDEHHMGAVATVHYAKDAENESDDPLIEEARANAHLICAAPLLLAYAECEAVVDSRASLAEARAVLRRHGWQDAQREVDFIKSLRATALARATPPASIGGGS